jgi:nucleotide-binding universal stress UspA family protein
MDEKLETPENDHPQEREQEESHREKMEKKATQASEKWGDVIENFHIPCPLCRGSMQAQGVVQDRLFEFASGEPGTVNPIDIMTISFICNRCGYSAEFDVELFNPSFLARLEGQAPGRVAQLSTREYHIMVPLRGDEENNTLLSLAAALARIRNGDISVLSAASGKKQAEALNLKVKEFRPTDQNQAPILLLSQTKEKLPDALYQTISRQGSDLLLIGAKGWSGRGRQGVRRVIDSVLRDALCDIAIIYDHGFQTVQKVLLATSGGPNAQAAAPLVLDIIKAFDAELHLLYVAAPEVPKAEKIGLERITDTLGDLDVANIKISREVVADSNPVQRIVTEAKNYDLLVLGGSPQDWRGSLRADDFSARIANSSTSTTLVLLAQKNRPRSWLSRLFSG